MGVCTCVRGFPWKPKASDPLELELLAVASLPVWMPGPGFRSSVRAARALNAWAISLTHSTIFTDVLFAFAQSLGEDGSAIVPTQQKRANPGKWLFFNAEGDQDPQKGTDQR